jgi:hypothetical protein
MPHQGHRWQYASYPSAVVGVGTPGAGVDGTGPWIDGSIFSSNQGEDGTGPWIDSAGSGLAGLDGTGPWITD